MKSFRENLYLLAATSYFLDNESVIDLGKHRVAVYNVKNEYYSNMLVEDEIPSICFWVAILENGSNHNCVYQTRFFKPTRIDVEEIEKMSENDKMRFVMMPVKGKKQYLSDSYLSLFFAQTASDGGLPVDEDYLSFKNPSREIQAEVAKKLKEKLNGFSGKSLSGNQFTI